MTQTSIPHGLRAIVLAGLLSGLVGPVAARDPGLGVGAPGPGVAPGVGAPGVGVRDPGVAVDDPSRVEAFKQFEAAAAQAPNVPVPRVVVAHAVPDIPVQVLAVRMDQAESLKATPIKLKRNRQCARRSCRRVRSRQPSLAGRCRPWLWISRRMRRVLFRPKDRRRRAPLSPRVRATSRTAVWVFWLRSNTDAPTAVVITRPAFPIR